ncbi:hypothetical protein BSKO_09323 [Bryopsis sp. KO-2023]|nr:hypothetical protein BSKO_09323 [Bryopsis sp. KO-2023]
MAIVEMRFAFGLGYIIRTVLFPLLLDAQAKYLAALNPEGIEWRHRYAGGAPCEYEAKGAEPLLPRFAESGFSRPANVSADCMWFPVNQNVPGLEMQFSSVAVYATAVILLGAGVFLVVVGPLGDFRNYRRSLLYMSLWIWPPAFSALLLVASPTAYLCTMFLGVTGSVSFVFSLRALLNAYLPVLSQAHHELAGDCNGGKILNGKPLTTSGQISPRGNCTLRKRSMSFSDEDMDMRALLEEKAKLKTDCERGTHERSLSRASIEVLENGEINHLQDIANLSPRLRTPRSLSSKKIPDLPLTVDGERSITKQEAQDSKPKKERIAASLSMNAMTVQLAGSFCGFLIQVWIVRETSGDPGDTFGLRSAIAFGGVTALIVGCYGLQGLKDRQGPDLPPGLQWWKIGSRRTIGTLKLLRMRWPHLLNLLLGRSLLWVCVNTLHIVAPLFMGREFGLQPAQLMTLLLIYMATAVPSTIFVKALMSRFPGRTLTAFKTFVILTGLLPMHYIFGMQEPHEMYTAMVVASFVFSPIPAIAWALMSEMIPSGYNATIMSLEGLLENLFSWVGPLVVGVIMDATGSMRSGIVCLSLFVFASIPSIWKVDMEAARKQKQEFDASWAVATADARGSKHEC